MVLFCRLMRSKYYNKNSLMLTLAYFKEYCYRLKLLFVLGLCFFSSLRTSIAQTDTDFWFVAPELTVGHNGGGSPAGGVPTYLRFSTMGLPATVTVSMPANRFNPATNPTGFVDIVFNMLENTSQSVDLSNWIWRLGLGDVNLMENKNLNASGINPFGIRVQATNPITAYYEVSNLRNADIWALKGRNALGTEFFTPFQNHGINGNYTPQPYSAIDIVATEDNTVVTIIARRPSSYGLPLTNVLAFTPITITLQRGQTFSLFPLNKSQAVADRLIGTHITSTKPIAVTLKDDSIAHTSGGCRDVVGDQLVPTNILGRQYAVVRTFLSNGSKRDHVYVLAIQDGTVVNIGGVNFNLNQGEQAYRQFPDGAVADPPTFWGVTSNNPIYVMHVGGFGCEQGMAILPPIDICTGSTQVAFTRSNDQQFFLTMMVRNGAEDGFLFDGVVRNDLINPASFQPVAGTDWRVARFLGAVGYTTAQISVGQHLVENTKDIFHLGIVNGGGGTTCFYGYFSDYNELEVAAVVAGTGSTILKTCYGIPVRLFATGGVDFHWTPETTLSDPFDQMPFANPTVNTQYKVVVSGACNMTDSALVNVLVSTPINALFTTDKVSGCAPLEVTFNDISLGGYSWQYDFGDGSPYVLYDNDPATLLVPPPPNPFNFTHTFQNNTALPIQYTITLLLKNADFCSSVYTKTIVVYPSITSSFTQNPDLGCNPLTVQFTNTSTVNTIDTYVWNFGDQQSSGANSPLHTFINPVPRDTTYVVSLEAISPFGCRDTAFSTVTVFSKFENNFTINSAIGCAPLLVDVTNFSIGDTAFYSWRLNGVEYQTNGGNHTLTLNNNGTAPIVYTLTLNLQNQQGCLQTVTRLITVYPEVDANFTIVNPVVCNLTEVIFQNTTVPQNPPINTYSWTFGDNAGSSLDNPTHTYNNQSDVSQVYTVNLTVTNPWSCTDSHSADVTVYSRLRADFSVLPSEGCAPLIVNIDNNSTGGIQSTLWTYGDGTPNSPTTSDHQHSYQNNGLLPVTRTLRLEVTNEGGCTDFQERFITIYPTVTAAFTQDNIVGCNPLPVSFTNQSKANAIFWNWSFGDGGNSVLQNPNHTFSNSTGIDANYSVTLVSTSEYGCFDVATQAILVYPFINASFAVNDYDGCSPHAFNVEVDKYPGILTYQWDFDGNGAYELVNGGVAQPAIFPRTLSNQTGAVIPYLSKLRVENHAGCFEEMTQTITVYPEVTASLSLLPGQVGCDPFDVNFTSTSILTGSFVTPDFVFWDFGDGGTSTEVAPLHTFYNNNPVNNAVYTTTLTASTIYGCTHQTTVPISVYPRLTAGFTFDQGSICSPFPVTFYPSSVGATAYNWNFGGAIPNETLATGAPFSRMFSNPDPDNITTYTITLEVENAGGLCRDTYTRDLQIYPHVVAQFAANTVIGCSDLDVTFTNTSTGGSLLFDWDFDDGQSFTYDTEDPVPHTFINRSASNRTFNVSLTAINPNGCTNQQIIPVTVYPKVESHFAFRFDSVCTPYNVVLENGSLNGTQYNWDFGHMGQTAITNNKNPFTQVFDNPTPNSILTYTISMTALDQITGCQDNSTSTIVVNPRVVSQFDVSADRGCNPLPVSFTNQSTGLGTYLWNFDDGNTTAEDSPSVIFAHPNRQNSRDYNVRLTSTNIHGCKSVSNRIITVYPLVESQFTIQNVEGCTPLSVNLTNTTVSPAYTYDWTFGDGQTSGSAQPGTVVINNNLFPLDIFNPTIQLTTRYIGDPTCNATFSTPVTVFPRVVPDFNADWAGCHPHPVDFLNLTDSYQNSATYQWSFGNQMFSSLSDPTITYLNPSFTQNAVYPVWLKATSMHGCIDSTTRNITVYPKPKSLVRLVGQQVGCPDFEVELQNLSLGTDLTFDYDFGDGDVLNTLLNTNVLHTYSNSTNSIASYLISLTTTTEFLCEDISTQTVYVYPEVRAAFAFDPGNAACNPFVVNMQNLTENGWNYVWNFDDGLSSNAYEPIHRFVNNTINDRIFNVQLTAYSEYNCVGQASLPLTVYAAPVASFVIDPPLKVFPDATFGINNLTYPQSPSWTYTWHFGDGYTSSDQEPLSHTYETWGPIANGFQYRIWLGVENSNCSDSISRLLTLLPPEPIALFESQGYSDCAPLEVYFINNSQYGNTYFWDFGDGTTSTDFEPNHTFHDAGYYNVKLIVTGDGGERHYYKTYRVYPNPIADFEVAPNRVLLPNAWVHVYNTSQYGNYFFWDLGDGFTTTIQPGDLDYPDILHEYKEIGEYRITLIAYTEYGCSDTTSRFPAVWVEGQGRIRFPNAFVPNPVGPNGGIYDEVDYKNEVFHPVGEGVVEYKLLIFNRWGEQLFQSNNIRIGWDGYYNGKLSPQDVYVWRAIGRFADGKLFDLRGNVTLLR